MKSSLTIKNRPINELIPYINNARSHSTDQIALIAGSIKEFGFNDPIAIDKDKGIISGHGRLEAARLLGLKEIPTIELSHLSNEQKKAYILAHNRIALDAGWDDELLKIELNELKDVGFDLSITGFNENDLEKFAFTPVEGLTDEDEASEPPTEPVTRLGDIWICGQHRLMCGDSTMIDQVEVLMDGEQAELLLTDPPYGVSYAGKNTFLNLIDKGNRNQTKIENDHHAPNEMNQFWCDVLKNAYSVLADKSSYYIFSPQGGDLMMMMMSITSAGFQLKHMLIWVKNNHVLGRCDYNYRHEPILFGWKQDGTHEFYGNGQFKTSVWEINKPLKNDLHPTMKPVELCEEPILNSTKSNSVVIDLFGGSGTTLIACEKTNRKCAMMEISPQYCDVIVKRWEKFTGKQSKLESTGQTFEELSNERVCKRSAA